MQKIKLFLLIIMSIFQNMIHFTWEIEILIILKY